MAFETGVSTSPSNLLSLLNTRLSTDGWTIVRNNGLAESGSSLQLSVSDPAATEGNQYNIVAFDTPVATARWELQASTADSGAAVNFYNHTGSPNTSGSNGTFTRFGHTHASTTDQGFSGASTAYFFFSGANPGGDRYCHIVLEGTAGVYWHCLFGTIAKAGTFTGGQYTAATVLAQNATGLTWPFQFGPPTSSSKPWIRFDNAFSSGSPGWRELNGQFSNIGGVTPALGMFAGGLDDQTQRTPFAPMLVPYWSSETPVVGTGPYVLAGHLPDVMQCSMEGRNPGETVTLGSDTWHIFPAHRKTTDGTSTTSQAYVNTNVSGPAPNNDSNIMGLAYRQP